MQDIGRMRIDSTPGSSHHHHHHGSPRAINLFHQTNNAMSCDEALSRIESAAEEDSAIELNSCIRLMEKPPLVKRLTMGLLKAAEDRSPLVHNSTLSSRVSQDGYVNEGIIGDQITSTFGESCRDTLNPFDTTTPAQQLVCNNTGFDYKRNVFHTESHPVNLAQRFPPAVPVRNDSLSLYEQNELKGASWFQAGIPREISLEVLAQQPPGAFLVRQSTTKPGCFALSLRVPPPSPRVAHYLILRTIKGYKIKGFTKEFSSLTALITHHSVMPELLPVPLALPRQPTAIGGKQKRDDFEYGDTVNLSKQINK